MSKPSASTPAFLALSCVGAFAVASPALAQDTGPKLGGMTVTDTAINETPVKAEQAASPKYTAPLLDTPQTITVITNKSIQQQNLLTLREVLQTVPGITFGAGEAGFGYGDRIIMRGQDAKSDVTIDGVRSSAFLNRNETFNIEQIEVTNGANSVYSGGGSVAGTINLVTKKPLAEDQSILSLGAGTDNYYRGSADVNKRVSDLISVRLNAVYHRNNVPGRDVEGYERWGIAPAITIGIDSPTNLTLQAEYLDDKAMPQYGIRYFPHLGGIVDDEFDRSGYYGFRNLDRQNSKTKALQAIFSHEFNDSVSIRNLTRYENIRQNTVTSQPNGTFCLSNGLQPPVAPATTVAPIPAGAACNVNIQTGPLATDVQALAVPAGYYLPTGSRALNRLIENETTYTQLDLNAKFETGGISHNLVLGASALWEGFSQRQGNLNRTAQGYDPYAAPYTVSNGVITANPLYNAATSLGNYLPLVSLGSPSDLVAGPGATTGLPRKYGTNEYVGPVNFALASNNRGEREVYAIYLFDTLSLGDMFEINGGVRYEHAKGRNRTQSISTTPGATFGQFSTATGPFSNSDTMFSYRVGAVFKPTPDTSLYIATSSSKNPSQASVDGACSDINCDLRPETTKNYEIGAKADLFNKRLLVSASVFRNDRDSIRVASGEANVPDQRLEGKQRVEGVSLGASGNVTDSWTISANYMYLDGKVLRGGSKYCDSNPTASSCASIVVPGTMLQNTPKHSGSVFTTYRFPFGLELGYGLTHQGKILLNQPTQAVPNAAVFFVPSYTIHHLMASYPITDQLMAQVNVQNLTNEKYVTTVRNALGSSWAQPAPTRSAVLSLNYTF